jgi:hypothetical protein
MCAYRKFTSTVMAVALALVQASLAQEIHIDGTAIDATTDTITLNLALSDQDLASGMIDPALMGWWKLDETSGATAADSTGQGNDGTLRGAPAWVKGFKGGALEFSTGRDYDYVAINRLTYNTSRVPAVTVATWVRTTNAGDQNLISFDRSEYWAVVINGAVAGNGQIAWRVQTDIGPVGLPSVLRVDDGNWHHVACVFDSGKLTIYIDGQASGTTTGGRTFGTGTTRYGFFGAGSLADRFDGNKTTSAPFVGDLDDVRVYSRVLAGTAVGLPRSKQRRLPECRSDRRSDEPPVRHDAGHPRRPQPGHPEPEPVVPLHRVGHGVRHRQSVWQPV